MGLCSARGRRERGIQQGNATSSVTIYTQEKAEKDPGSLQGFGTESLSVELGGRGLWAGL